MFLSLAQDRRSIRKFKPKPIDPGQIDLLVEAALRSPSSMGKNPWSFIIVDDADQLKALASAKQFGSAFVKGAPLAIVICADPQISDVWIEDASIAAIYIHLAATSIGLGSCWVQIRNRMQNETTPSKAFVADLLGIEAHFEVLALVAIGYPDEEKPAHAIDSLQYEKVHKGEFGKPWQTK